jgi:hypothetical protein
MQTLSGLQRKLSAELALPVAKLFTGLDQIAQLLSGKLMSSAKAWAVFINGAIPVIAKNVFSLASGFIAFGNDASQGIMLVSEALFGLESGGNRSLSIFQTMGDLLATLPNQVFIVLKKVAALTLGTFQTIGNAFARALTEPMILAMNLADKLIRKLGGSGFTDLAGDTEKIRDTFSLDISQNIKDLLDAGGLLDVTELEAENDRIIAKRAEDEEEFAKKLKLSFDRIGLTFDNLKTEVSATGKVIKESVRGLVNVNQNRASAVLSGSQEEFRILSGQSDKNLKVQMEIRDAIKRTNKIFANIGTS